MNARTRAYGRFCEMMESYIQALVEDLQYTWDEAVDHALLEYDEVFRELYREELIREELRAGE